MRFAVFVEGQTESIFIESLLREYFGSTKLQTKKITQRGRVKTVSFASLKDTDQSADHLCFVVETPNDETVLSRLKENCPGMRKEGVSAFFALRDLKCEQYANHGDALIERLRSRVRGFGLGDNVFVHFAKMETEAWFLAAPSFLSRIDATLTLSRVVEETGVDLVAKDPQEGIRSPAAFLDKVMRIANRRYDKHRDEVYGIVSKLDWEELCLEARNRGKISFFFRFLDDLDRTLTTACPARS